MNKSYYIDRVHKQIIYTDQEFQHHGVEGQRWGVITRNVGVNYVPIGRGGGSERVGSLGGFFNRGNKPAKPSSRERVMDNGAIIQHIKSNTFGNEFKNVPDKLFKKILNDDSVKNAPNDKLACKNAIRMIGQAANQQFSDGYDYLLENGIDPMQNSMFDNMVLPGQTMSYAEAEYNWYSKGAVDITSDLGYKFNSPNAPKVIIGTYNGVPTGQFGLYNKKMYTNIDKMIKDYNKSLKR